MAHSPSFNPRPSTRYSTERRWLMVIAAFAMFAYYIASGDYALSVPSGSPSGAGTAAETSSVRVEQSGTLLGSSAGFESIMPSADPRRAAPVAETSSATVEAATQQNSTAVAQPKAPARAQSQSAAVPAPQPAVSAPPPAAAPSNSANVVERWRSAGIIIVTQGQEWDAQSLANVDAALSALPPSLRSQLGNPALGQLQILVNSQGRALSGKQPYGGIANFFATGDGVNELVMAPRQRVSTILHELGHAYNLRRVGAGQYARVLIDPEMESFLAATGWQVMATRDQIAQAVDHMRLNYQYAGSFRWPEVSKFDPLEDFANSFAMYFYDPAGLRAQSPERHAWMASHLAR